MSVTLLTGVPGSGKTLKAVWDHLRPLVGHSDTQTDESGNEVKIPSVVYTNINSLLLDHELIEGGGTWTGKAGEWTFEGNNLGLRCWHQWAKPGAKIFVDEFQKFWPPRPNGAAVPPDIQALDTHRHMGVDFVLITQNCLNVDRHILGLVDRHIHVRRVANMPLAVCYEWDHASRTLNYKNSMTKSPWRYPRMAYRLYKSAELHTKQKRKVPGLVWFILFGFVGSAFAFPTLYSRLTDRVKGSPAALDQKLSTAPGKKPEAGQKVEYIKDGVRYTVETTSVDSASMPLPGASAPAVAASGTPAAPVLAGCIRTPKRCACLDTAGSPVDLDPKTCADRTGSNLGPPIQFTDSPRTSPPGGIAADFNSVISL